MGDAEMRRWFACWMKEDQCNLKYAICSRLIGLDKVDRKVIGLKQFCFTDRRIKDRLAAKNLGKQGDK